MSAFPDCDLPVDSAEGNYGRLFSGNFASHEENALTQLAEQMRDSNRKRAAPERPNRTPVMKSGYAYLGQFIDHDADPRQDARERFTS